MFRVLPHRQLRIGQEESNLPAEQAVKIKAIKFKLGGFCLFTIGFIRPTF